MMAQAGSTAGADPVLARAHHGSVSKDQRALIEDDLKSGRLRCVVATSSLELGIDMGAVDLVVQVESPPSVASGLQRVGRAGHQVGEISQGVLFPKHRADLVHTAITVERMLDGKIERLSVPANPLDILAQQTVAATALGAIDVEEWFATRPAVGAVRLAPPLRVRGHPGPAGRALPLATNSPNCGPGSSGTGTPGPSRAGPARSGWPSPPAAPSRTAGCSASTSSAPRSRAPAVPGGARRRQGSQPGRRAAKGGRRVGELDEEMVYESRVGDIFALGATSWKIEDITHDRVLVSPAFGQPGKLPFWKGDSLGRPVDLGRALGAFVRELSASDVGPATERCKASGLDDFAANNLIQYLAEQKLATEVVPSDTHPGGGTVPRRTRRLAGGAAQPLRHARARAVGPGRGPAPAPALRDGRLRHGRRRRHRAARAHDGGRAARAPSCSCSTRRNSSRS